MEEKIKLQLQLASSMEDSFREEEFYEEIEAPKFVDFTTPDHYCPDDRYWFCSRVGCDQKHEEEMDSEAIYKNFVLRVMAARSPNVGLRKALTRKPTGETKKCPLSAPPKPSKSRLPRLAIASSISKKLLLDGKGTNKPPSTPKARVKHVAAKYMTTVKKKKGSSPNPNAFRSVRNPKRTSITLPKKKIVAKALAFNSPKKARKVKASEELATPITKLCEGMKKMEISKKTSKECKSVKKALPLPLDASNKQRSISRKNDPKFSKSVKSKAKKNDEKKHESVLEEAKSGNDSSDMEIDGKSKAGSLESCSGMTKPKGANKSEENSMTSGSGSASSQAEATGSESTLTSEVICFPDSEDRISAHVDSVPRETPKEGDQGKTKNDSTSDGDLENQNPVVLDELTSKDGKENAFDSNNIRDFNSGNVIKHDVPVKHKIKAVDKALKEHCSAGTQGVKCRKLKPTNPKPFRLRTDERGILKEATLERKTNSDENAMGTENQQCVGKELSENREKQSKKEMDKSFKPDRHKPIKSKYMSTSKVAEPKSDKGVVPCSEKSSKRTKPQREAVLQVKSGFSVIEKSKLKPKEPRKTSKMVANPTSKASVPIVSHKLAAQGRRAATIPREPNFQNLHKPRSCTKNTA